MSASYVNFEPAELNDKTDAEIRTKYFAAWADYCRKMGDEAFGTFKIHENLSNARLDIDALTHINSLLENDVRLPNSNPVNLSKRLKDAIANNLRSLQDLMELREKSNWKTLPTVNFSLELIKIDTCIFNLENRKPPTFDGQLPQTESFYNTVKKSLTQQKELIQLYSTSKYMNNSEFSKQISEPKALETKLEEIKGSIKLLLVARNKAKSSVGSNSVMIQQQLAASAPAAPISLPRPSEPASITRKGSNSPVGGSPSRDSQASKSSESSVSNASALDLTHFKNPPTPPSAPPSELDAAAQQSQVADNNPRNACCVIQ